MVFWMPSLSDSWMAVEFAAKPTMLPFKNSVSRQPFFPAAKLLGLPPVQIFGGRNSSVCPRRGIPVSTGFGRYHPLPSWNLALHDIESFYTWASNKWQQFFSRIERTSLSYQTLCLDMFSLSLIKRYLYYPCSYFQGVGATHSAQVSSASLLHSQ